jgi:WD40 repeat protein
VHCLAAATKNGFITIWELTTPRGTTSSSLHLITARLERRIEAHKRTIHKVKWHPVDQSVLVSASQDGNLKIWDRRSVSLAQQQQRSGGGGGRQVTDKDGNEVPVGGVISPPNGGAIRDVAFAPNDFR